ncbi:MAG: hypothetical protein ACQEQE_09860 [Bacillota bacterium]
MKYFNQLNISIIGLLFSIYLVINEIIIGDYCPEFLNIPACIIVLIAFFLVILGNFNLSINNILRKTGLFIGLILAIYFSYNQIMNISKCPVILNIFLCYVSLITFIILIYLENQK